jgi:hypothetical protein
LAHLFGAGHWESAPPGLRTGLFDNSKALIYQKSIKIFSHWVTYTYRTVMGRYVDSPCSPAPKFCVQAGIYSDNELGDVTRINSNAIDTTAVSVANYRRGIPSQGIAELCADGIDNDGDGGIDNNDPQCNMTGTELPPPPPPPPVCDGNETPFGVYAFLVETCYPQGGQVWTYYRVKWSHQCSSQVGFYQVWIESPPGSPPFLFSQPTQQLENILVDGATGKIRIAACRNVADCSPPSPNGPIITDTC